MYIGTKRQKDRKQKKKVFVFNLGFPKHGIQPAYLENKKKTLLVIIMRITQTCKNKMERMGKHMT
jgi:hypothetical protein